MHHPSVLRHINPMKFLCFAQKEPIKVQFFRLLSALMEVPTIPHAIFETTRSRFIQILHHCSVSWKITPLYYFSTNLIYFGQKRGHRSEIFRLLTCCLKIHQIPHVIFETTNQFFFLEILHHSSLLWETNLLYFFSLNFIWVRQRSSSKCKISDFRMLTWNFTKFVFDKLPLLKVYKISTTK